MHFLYTNKRNSKFKDNLRTTEAHFDFTGPYKKKCKRIKLEISAYSGF